MSTKKRNGMALPEQSLLKQRYLVRELLGSGGFGLTYKALDQETGQICAIKEYVPLNMVKREKNQYTLFLSNNRYKEQFERGRKNFMEEANILQSIAYNPLVPKLFDCFHENGTSYFVIEYIEGITLRKLIKQHGGRMPFDETMAIFIQLARCLDLLHTKYNIFHRDIGPDNILVTSNGKVYLIDFGNAKFLSGRENQFFPIVLKQGFAPLEQYSRSSKQGAYTDVYALASTLYYSLTGEKVPVALKRLSKDTLKPLDYYLGAHYHELSVIFEQALALRAADRMKTMREFLDKVEKFQLKHEPGRSNS